MSDASDGNGGPRNEFKRLQDALNALKIFRFWRHHRQAPNGLEQAHQRKSGFDGNRVGLDEIDFHQRKIATMDGASFVEFAAQTVAAELSHFCRNFVGGDGDYAAAAQGEERQRDGVVARENCEVVGHRVCQCRHLRNISGSFLDAHDVFHRGQTIYRRWLEVGAAAAGYVVKNNRQSRGARDGAIVLVEAFLRGLVVIRRDGKQAVGAKRFEFARKFDYFLSVVAAGASEYRNFSVGFPQRNFDDAEMFGARKRWIFAGGAARHQEIHARIQLPQDKFSQRCLIK